MVLVLKDKFLYQELLRDWLVGGIQFQHITHFLKIFSIYKSKHERRKGAQSSSSTAARL